MKAKVIRSKNSAVLLERVSELGVTERVSIPDTGLEPDSEGLIEVDEETFDRGIPYGLPFESTVDSLDISSSEIANALHNVGLWTAEDLNKNPGMVQGALLSLMASTISQVGLMAKKFSTKER